MVSFVFIALASFFFAGGVLASLARSIGLSLAAAAPVAAIAGVTVLFFGYRLSAGRDSDAGQDTGLWEKRLLAVTGYAVLLRLVYMGPLALLHEEAYYWNYGQHLALAYFDHPPMVGWIIRAFTAILGDTEFAVRAGPFGCWLVAAYYIYRLTAAVLGKSIARCAVMLMAVLPVYFGLGLIMIPDAPLVACWAGALYYIYRTLIDERPWSWIGVGIFMGLALLSKYTAGLLGLSVLFFIIFDRRARKWLKRPEAYLALGIAVVLFSPVIWWNAQHDWASFRFQSAGRLADHFDFDLADLIGSILILLTPTGLLTFGAVLRARSALTTGNSTGAARDQDRQRAFWLLMTLTVVPLAVFVGFSLIRNIKLHWTAPIWLGAIPYMAAFIAPGKRRGGALLPGWPAKLWPATIVVVLLIYGAALQYLTLGFPGVPYSAVLGVGMQDLAGQIEAIVEEHEHVTGETPLVVCMDKDRLAGWIAFYRAKKVERAAPPRLKKEALRVSGGHFFGKNSGMYRYWFSPQAQKGKTLLLVARRRGRLSDANIGSLALRLGRVRNLTVHKNGKAAGRFYYRFLYGYRPKPPT